MIWLLCECLLVTCPLPTFKIRNFFKLQVCIIELHIHSGMLDQSQLEQTLWPNLYTASSTDRPFATSSATYMSALHVLCSNALHMSQTVSCSSDQNVLRGEKISKSVKIGFLTKTRSRQQQLRLWTERDESFFLSLSLSGLCHTSSQQSKGNHLQTIMWRPLKVSS